MRSILVFIIFLATAALPASLFAQSEESDDAFAKGIEAFNARDYKEAVGYFEKANELDLAQLPSTQPARAEYAQHWLAHTYYLLGDTQKARSTCQFLYKFQPIDRRMAIESDAEADISFNLAAQGDIEGALTHAIRGLEIETATFGENSLACLGSCINIVDLSVNANQLANALVYYNKGLNIVRNLSLDNSIYEYQLLSSKTAIDIYSGDTNSALSNMPKIRNVAESLFEEFDDKAPLAVYHSTYARVCIQSFDNEKALEECKAAFELLMETYNPDNEECISNIYDCLTMLNTLGQYDTIIEILNPVIADSAHLKPTHKGILLSFLGDSLKEGNIATYTQSLALLKDSPYEDTYYSTMCNMASAYVTEANDYLKAIEILRDVADHFASIDSSHPVYRRALTNMGQIYSQLGDLKNSFSCYKSAVDTFSPEEKEKSPDYALTYLYYAAVAMKYSYIEKSLYDDFSMGYNMLKELNNAFNNKKLSDFTEQGIGIKVVANAMNDFIQTLLGQASSLISMNWRQWESTLSDMLYNHLIPTFSLEDDTALRSLSLLAHTKYILGNYDEAIRLTEQVIEVSRKIGVPYDDRLHDLAYYQYSSGDTYGAFDNMRHGLDYLRDRIITNYRWMTAAERNLFTYSNRGNIDNLPLYAAKTPDDPRYATLGYDALLFSKGLLLNSSIELSKLIQEDGDAAALGLLRDWRELMMNYSAISDKSSPEAKQIKARADEIERRLLESSKAYGDYTNALLIEYQDVQKALAAKDVAIEFFSFQKDAKARTYGAFLLTKTDAPRYIPLGDDTDWKSLTDRCYDDSRLFDKLFSGLKEYLPHKGEGSVYFSPDGILHTIAIENLKGAENYNFKRLSSTREIAMTGNPTDKPTRQVAIFGGEKYGLGDWEEYEKDYTPSGERASSGFLAKLPATKLEAQNIQTLLSTTFGTDIFLEDKAKEEQLKALSGKGVGILHIATHGFFEMPDNVNDQTEYDEKAMDSSGLYLAGAQNSLWDDPAEGMVDDGILSAHEISLLDFRGLRLATLSACETGRGSIGSEGVFGLQRGFKQAGAKSILMSLWKVDDDATRLLMEEFYKAMLSGQDLYESLKSAQNIVKLQHPEPYYWAGFILIDANNPINI